jgi:hypothetical protein
MDTAPRNSFNPPRPPELRNHAPARAGGVGIPAGRLPTGLLLPTEAWFA